MVKSAETPQREDTPALRDSEEKIMHAHQLYREEYAQAAAALQERLGPGYRVTHGKKWKGYGLTIYLPPR